MFLESSLALFFLCETELQQNMEKKTKKSKDSNLLKYKLHFFNIKGTWDETE